VDVLTCQPGRTLAAKHRLRIGEGLWPSRLPALPALEEALVTYRDIGDRGGEAEALNEAGTLRRVCGELDQARDAHRQALDLARQISSAWDEALAGLGRCASAVGHSAEAGLLLRQALEISQQIGAAETPELLAELDALTGPPTAR
jgi:tetratricopeptide (TPR) repeat protein